MNQIRRFTAQNAKLALEEVHKALGPDAVVVNIRKIPKGGLQGMFQSPEVEVSALLPAARQTAPCQPQMPLERSIQYIQAESQARASLETGNGSRLDLVDDTPIEIPKPSSSSEDKIIPVPPRVESSETWAGEQVLESIGILPRYVERLTRLAKRRFPAVRTEIFKLGRSLFDIHHSKNSIK